MEDPYTEQYNLDIQHDFGHGMVLDVGYYGSQGHHLIGVYDLNQPQPNAYLTAFPQCHGVKGQAGAVIANCWGTVDKAGNPVLAVLQSNQSPILNSIRPYKGYLGIYENSSIFNQNYHSLQVQLQKKFSGDSMFNVAYTWSKSLTDNQTDRSTAPQNTYDIRGDYGPTQQDRTHVVTANFVYELPFYRAQRGIVGHFAGGWEFSGTAQFWTGLPYTIATNTLNDPTGQGCQTTSPCAVRPNQIGDPNVGGAKTLTQWFNTAAFANVPVGPTAPAGGYLNGSERRASTRGPGLQIWNLAVFKNIKISERVNTQLRLESFNTFNHTNLDGFSSTLGSSTFGQISGARANRIAQLGLKLNF